MHEEEIVKADKSLQKKLSIFIGVISIVGLIIKWNLPKWIEYLKYLDPEKATLIIELTLVFSSLIIFVFCLYFLRIGWKILKQKQFPLAGMKVISDTHVVRGWRAQLRGTVIIFCSLLMMVAIITAAFCVHYLFHSLLRK
jgi:succinate dehydrogenase hydrophobic anchor subunit